MIVGMPRSGSSLLEQILAGHPDIYGAGELRWFSSIERRLGSDSPYPECLLGLGDGALKKIGQDYTNYVSELSDGQPCFIDKALSNYQRLGLIRMVLPNVKVIHCRRSVRDNCVSIFNTRLPASAYYGCDLFKLGVCYRIYQRLMSHWESVFPESILRVDYEDVVEEPESTSRRVMDYIGLPWDPSCLDYQKTSRIVRTASDHQVRKPIYKSAVGRWKRYEAWLDDLEKGLSMDLGELADGTL